jgi:transposase
MKKQGRKASEREGNQKQPRYSEEFKRQLVDLVRGGKTPEELGRQFEPSAQAIRNWLAQAEREEGTRQDGLTSAEREELRRLQRENARLREEREILSKAAAWFAQETQKTPNGSSRS